MNRCYHIVNRLHRVILILCVMLCVTASNTIAQGPVKKYTVKNGKMYIELGKNLSSQAIDSFIVQFDLGELYLKELLKRNMRDSLEKYGWQVEVNNKDLFILSKPMLGFDKIKDPGEKILFTENRVRSGTLFPAVSSRVIFGMNRFRDKNDFRVDDSTVVFFLKNNLRANKVFLSGSFVNWSETALPMQKTDSGWIASVKIGPGKYWYKFIIDGRWFVDNDNRNRENDGEGNINSVYFKTNYLITLDTFVRAKRVNVAGTFNNWTNNQLQMEKTDRGWRLPVYLGDGTHTYRFIVDGRWMADPFNPDRVPNEYNEYNSVIRVGKPYIIKLDGYTQAKQVILTGSFNGWRRDELFMRKTADGWELPYHIGPGNYEYQFVVDGKRLGSPHGNGNLTFTIQPNYTFKLNGFANAKTVYLAGDFNNWSPNGFPMEKVGNEWVLKVHLSPGKHLYKFVVDGNWIIDPGNKLWEQNEHGTGNSVVWLEAIRN